MKKFTWKRWLIVVATIILFLFGVVGGINYAVDPLWCFNHGAFIGKFQPMFDERQQKTNWLTFHDVDIDTVILGNSRVTYLDTRDVPGKAFNYAVAGMRPLEFQEYLTYASDCSSSEITTVILGLSFVGTNRNLPFTFKLPVSYIEGSNSPGYRFQHLLSLRLLKLSIEWINRQIMKNPHKCYIRESGELYFRTMVLPVSQETLQRKTIEQVEIYKKSAYSRNYEYNSNVVVYEKLQENFPNAKFICFTTPVSEDFLKLLVQQGLFNEYRKWISELVNYFGEIWNFMYPNPVTRNSVFFSDAHHYSPEICKIIIEKATEKSCEAFEDFGVKVTRENLLDHLNFLEGEKCFGLYFEEHEE